jgi:ParB family transcriptional regulator, chromosome partitioning protein
MTTSPQKITLSSARDIPFNKLVLSQSNVWRVKAGVSIEDLAAGYRSPRLPPAEP